MSAVVYRESTTLSSLLQRHLTRARVLPLELDDTGGLSLYLLDPAFPQQDLSEQEINAALNYPAYWAFCWASGQVLAAHLYRQPQWVAGKCVLDFGCGSGVAAIAAARAGAARVIACDLDPDALVATRCNADLNGVVLETCEDFDQCDADIDVIIVADVLYDRANLSWLSRFLERAPTVLVADSRVRDFNYPGYRRLGEWQSCTLPDLDESSEFRRVSIYCGDAGLR